MPKKNIEVEGLGAWDDYKGKPLEETLKSIYSHAVNFSDTASRWYWTSIQTKKRSSLIIRFITFLLLIAGTVLPIMAGLNDDTQARLQCTQYGVVALACAGLLQVADKVFGWSSGWLRYITTVTAMVNLTRKFQMEWASYIVDKGANLGAPDTKLLFDLAKKFEDDLAKLQSDETDKWIAEFNSGLSLLGELIKSQREAGEKSIEAARATIESADKARQNGAIEVTLVHKAAPTTVKIAINDEPAKEFTGTSWTRLDVKPGPYTVTITTTDIPQTIQKFVKVPPGDVGRLEIKL